jgi:hypothetical protein
MFCCSRSAASLLFFCEYLNPNLLFWVGLASCELSSACRLAS